MPFVPLNFISLSAIHLNFYSVSTTNIPLSQIVSVSHHLGHLGCLCPSGLMQIFDWNARMTCHCPARAPLMPSQSPPPHFLTTHVPKP
jgi:hypothetical protein